MVKERAIHPVVFVVLSPRPDDFDSDKHGTEAEHCMGTWLVVKEMQTERFSEEDHLEQRTYDDLILIVVCTKI